MNLILVSPNQTGEIVLDKRTQDHLKHTLRSRDGDILRVGVLNGQKGCGQLHISESGEYILRLLPLSFRKPEDVLAFIGVAKAKEHGAAEIRDSTQPAREDSAPAETDDGQLKLHNDGDEETKRFDPLTPDELLSWQTHPYHCGSGDAALAETRPFIDLLLALPRPRVFDKLLQYLSAMSIGRATFFASSRSDLAYFSSPKTREANMMASVHLGLEQGMRTVAPKVALKASLREALALLSERECHSPSTAAEEENYLTLIAHPYPVEWEGARREPLSLLETSILDHTGPILIVLGPEGGFCDREVIELSSSLPNAQLIHLGKDILRCEVAAIALIAQVQLLTAKSPLRSTSCKRLSDPSIGNTRIAIPIPGRKKRPTPDEHQTTNQDNDG